jgi:hypothetical protein
MASRGGGRNRTKDAPVPDGRLTGSYPASTEALVSEKSVSSRNQALTRCAFLGTNPTSKLITSGLPVTREEWSNAGWEAERL